MKTVTNPKKAKQVRQKRVFEEIEWINDAYSEAKLIIDELIKDWNPKNPRREIKANLYSDRICLTLGVVLAG